MSDPPPELIEKVSRVRLLLLDVDGVLTDGRMFFGHWPSAVTAFNSLDGQGLKMLRRAGVEAGIITGRESDGVSQRARMLGISILHQGIGDKLKPYELVKRQTGATDSEIAYMGDDLPDLPLLRRAGVAIAPPNACKEVLQQVDYVTAHPGGQGAVRDAVELILKSQGKWQDAVATYYE